MLRSPKTIGYKKVEAEFSTLCSRVPTVGAALPDFKGRVEVYFCWGSVRTQLKPEVRRKQNRKLDFRPLP